MLCWKLFNCRNCSWSWASMCTCGGLSIRMGERVDSVELPPNRLQTLRRAWWSDPDKHRQESFQKMAPDLMRRMRLRRWRLLSLEASSGFSWGIRWGCKISQLTPAFHQSRNLQIISVTNPNKLLSYSSKVVCIYPLKYMTAIYVSKEVKQNCIDCRDAKLQLAGLHFFLYSLGVLLPAF